jgi:hypothetical protein
VPVQWLEDGEDYVKLDLSGEILEKKIHSKRVEKMKKYSQNYLEASVWFFLLPTRLECSFASSPLVSSALLHLLHSFRVYFLSF